MEFLKKNWKKYLLGSMVFFVLFFIYRYNFLHIAPEEIFHSFQKDSDALVFSAIKSCDSSQSAYGLFFEQQESGAGCKPYISTMGIQGHAATWLQNFSVGPEGLMSMSAGLLALTMLIIALNLSRLSLLLSFVFGLFAMLNPWTVLFARSPYWIAFIWWLPFLLGILFLRQRTSRVMYLLGIGLLFLFKFLSGYEYASSIGMLAGIPFVLFYQMKKIDFKTQLYGLAQVASVLIGAFIIALLIHSYFRGDSNLRLGLEKIVVEDVLRRTYGEVTGFDDATMRSLKAPWWSVVWMYINHTPYMLAFFKLSRLPLVFMLGLIFLVFRCPKNRQLNLWVFSYYILTPLSWYVLAKGHSKIHTHINYILWSFSLPFLVYTAITIYREMRKSGT